MNIKLLNIANCLFYCIYVYNHVKYCIRQFFVFVAVPCSMSCKNCNGVVITEKFLERIANIKTGKIEQHWSNKRNKTDITEANVGPTVTKS